MLSSVSWSEKRQAGHSLGLHRSARLLVVCHTYRDESEHSATIRIFSARKAVQHDAKDYE